jgi:L-iditol 2-dehydrogenase
LRALRLHGLRDLRLHDEPIPEPGHGESRVRVTSVGVCGSDLHWFSEAGIGDAKITKPLVLGHEAAGFVEDPRSPLNGRPVAIDPAIPCLECEFCLEGNPNFCINLRFAGHGEEDGSLREYLTWPDRCLFPLPGNLSADDGAMLEPLGIALHAVDLGQVRPGMAAGVFGCGPIGLLILQVARLAGAFPIIATDRLSHRLEAARALGATTAILSEEGRENSAVWEATGGQGVAVAFEAAGENPAVETAIEAARPGGQVILVGIPSEDRTDFTASTARRKGLTIKLCRRMKLTYPRAIRLVEQGMADVRSLVTHRFPLDQAEQAFHLAQEREGIKVMINLTPQASGLTHAKIPDIGSTP